MRLTSDEHPMFEVPDPLHPAVVHFPIALIFLGTLISILSFFTRRGALPQFTAAILLLAAGSAQFAVITGGDEADDLIQRMPNARPLIRDHAEWGERTRTIAAIAAVVAIVALTFYRVRGFRRILALITAIIGAAACYCAVEATQGGGGMVYHQGVGVGVTPNGTSASPSPANATPAPSARATPGAEACRRVGVSA
jgi:uncharacterized membrane protein